MTRKDVKQTAAPCNDSLDTPSAESFLDVSSLSTISLFNNQNTNEFSFIKTSTFDESQFSQALNNEYKQEGQVEHDYVNVETRTVINDTITLEEEAVYSDCLDGVNSRQEPPTVRMSRRPQITSPPKPVVKTSTTNRRFQSPPKLPSFYYDHLPKQQQTRPTDSPVSSSKETQTTNQVILIKKKDFLRSLSPENTQTSKSYECKQSDEVGSYFLGFFEILKSLAYNFVL